MLKSLLLSSAEEHVVVLGAMVLTLVAAPQMAPAMTARNEMLSCFVYLNFFRHESPW